jgi:hypothetical protein
MHNIYDCPILIKQNVEEKRRLRRDWHRLRTTESKILLNTATQEFKEFLNSNRNDCIQTFLQGLTPTESTDCSLWKATKKIKQVKKPSPPLRTSQGTWSRSNVENANAFAESKSISAAPLRKCTRRGTSTYTTSRDTLPTRITNLKRAEVQEVINSLNPKKSSGYDLITGKILQELPIIGVKYHTHVFNAVLFKWHFTAQWKVAQIIILKPGKPPSELTSFRPISLLPTVSKDFF